MPGPLQEDQLYGHQRYAAFYDLELADFADDLAFYRAHLPSAPCRILELGCGTGRVSRALAGDGHQLVGIDLSPAMLAAAMTKRTDAAQPHYLCMDITRLALQGRFDAILIPYNTLNLLTAPGDLDRCLAALKPLLATEGRVLAQLHVPDAHWQKQEPGKRFQFRIMECPDGSKVIKETITGHDPVACQLAITERYRLRFRPGMADEDWQYSFRVLAHSATWWQERFISHGLVTTAMYGDYHLTPFDPDQHSILLLVAPPESPSKTPASHK